MIQGIGRGGAVDGDGELDGVGADASPPTARHVRRPAWLDRAGRRRTKTITAMSDER